MCKDALRSGGIGDFGWKKGTVAKYRIPHIIWLIFILRNTIFVWKGYFATVPFYMKGKIFQKEPSCDGQPYKASLFPFAYPLFIQLKLSFPEMQTHML